MVLANTRATANIYCRMGENMSETDKLKARMRLIMTPHEYELFLVELELVKLEAQKELLVEQQRGLNNG